MAVTSANISTSITLDTSQFDKAINNATAKLSKLERDSKKLNDALNKNEEQLKSSAKDLGKLTRAYNGIERGISSTSDSVQKLSRDNKLTAIEATKLSNRLEELGGRAKLTGQKLDALSQFNNHYGRSLKALNPILQRARQTEAQLAKAREKYANSGVAGQRKLWQERERIINAEIEQNKRAIQARLKVADDLARAEKSLNQAKANAQQSIATNTGRTDSKSVGRLNQAQEKLRIANEQLAEAKRLRDLIDQSTQALKARNDALTKAQTHLRNTNNIINQQNDILRRQKQIQDELKQKDIEREKTKKELARAERERLNALAKHERALNAERERAIKKQERDAKEASRQATQAKKADERELRDFTIQQEREINAERKRQLQEQKQRKREEMRLAREAKQEQEKLLREQIQAERNAQKEILRAKREAHAEAMRMQREEIQARRQMGADLALTATGFGVAGAIGSGVHTIAEFQDIQDRLRAYNFSKGEFDEIQERAKRLTKENKFLSLSDAVQGNIDAVSALGHNDPEFIETTIHDAVKNAYVLRAKGYDKGTQSDVVKNIYGFIEARQQTTNAEAAKKSIDLLRRMVITSGGKITIADIETVIRNMGDTAITMSDDGFLKMLPLIEQYKTAGGGNGGGGGVSKAGTLIKMISLLASGRTMTNRFAMDMLGAGELSSDFAEGTKKEFIKVDELNKIISNGIKNAGFKNKEQVSKDPIEAIMGMRGGILDYMMADKNWKRFFGETKKFHYVSDRHGRSQMYDTETGEKITRERQAEIENAAFKTFFAQSGMSNNNVTAMMTLMNQAFAERVYHSAETAKNTKDIEGLMNDLSENWNANIEILKASAQNFAIAFEPLLEKLVVLPKMLSEVLNVLTEFANNNPALAQIAMLTVGFGALGLSVKLGVGLFGGLFRLLTAGRAPVSAVATATSTLGTTITRTTASTGLLGKAIHLLAGVLRVLISPITAIGRMFGIIPANALTATSRTTAIINRFAGVLGGFVRLAGPLALAGFMGWALGSWLKDIKVYGLSIQQHFENLINYIMMGVDRAMYALKSLWNGAVAIAKSAVTLDFTGSINEFAEKHKQDRKELDEKTKLRQSLHHTQITDDDIRRKIKEQMPSATKEEVEEQLKIRKKNMQTLESKESAKKAHANDSSHQKDDIPKTFFSGHGKPVSPSFVTKGKKGGGLGGSDGTGKRGRKKKGDATADGGFDGRQPREFENKFFSSYSDLQAKIANRGINMADIDENHIPSYDELARIEFQRRWLSGEFDDGNNPLNRKFAKRPYDKNNQFTMKDIDWNGTDKASGLSVQQWLDMFKESKRLEDIQNGFTKAVQTASNLQVDFVNAQELLNSNLSRVKTKYSEVSTDFEKYEIKNKTASQDAGYLYHREIAKFNASLFDVVNKAQEFKESEEQQKISLLEDSVAKSIAEASVEYKKFINEYNGFLDPIIKERLDLEEVISEATAERLELEQKHNIELLKQRKKELELAKRTNTEEYKYVFEVVDKWEYLSDLINNRNKRFELATETIQNARKYFDQRGAIEQEKYIRNTRTEADHLMAQWRDYAGAINKANAKFAESFATGLYDKFLDGQKVNFKEIIAERALEVGQGYLKSVYADVFQKVMGDGAGSDVRSVLSAIWNGKGVGQDTEGKIGYLGEFINWFRGVNRQGQVIDRRNGQVIEHGVMNSPKEQLINFAKSLFENSGISTHLAPIIDNLKQRLIAFNGETSNATDGLLKLSKTAIKNAIIALIEWASNLTRKNEDGTGGFFANIKSLFLGNNQEQNADLIEAGDDQADKITESIENMNNDTSKGLSNLGGSLNNFVGSAIGRIGSTSGNKNVQRAGNAIGGAMEGYQSGGFVGALIGGAVGLFAKNGEAFNGKSQIQAFANGGAFTNKIFSSPTMFKFANGGGFNLGVMGEAGPEAIMPLKRDSSGRLGVSVNGGSVADGGVINNVSISINVSGDATDMTSHGANDKLWRDVGDRVKIVVQQELANQKRLGGSMR